MEVDAEAFQIDAPLLRPVEDGRLEGLGAHDRTVDLLPRQALEELHDVLVRIFRPGWACSPLLDQRAQGLEAAMAEVQPKVR